MDEKEIRKYADLMHELDLTGIEVDSNGAVVRIERASGGTRRSTKVSNNAARIDEETKASEFTDDRAIEIKSPLVGVFYSSSSEGGEALAQVGKRVKKGELICIIESMKLMNEILSEYDGVITEVCVKNGEAVDFGHILFKIREEI